MTAKCQWKVFRNSITLFTVGVCDVGFGDVFLVELVVVVIGTKVLFKYCIHLYTFLGNFVKLDW